jgi:hypothetical protein
VVGAIASLAAAFGTGGAGLALGGVVFGAAVGETVAEYGGETTATVINSMRQSIAVKSPWPITPSSRAGLSS